MEINPGSIYGGNIERWDWNKLRFVNFLMFYSSIKIAYDEPPPKRIIRNDRALDRWVQEQKEKRRVALYGADNTSTSDGRKKTPHDAVVFGTDTLRQ